MPIAAIPGPLGTCYGTLRNPLHEAWLTAAREAGYPATGDINGFQQEGFGRMDMTVQNGRRCSAANAYLRPAMARRNLAVRTHALATRILFEGRRASGVRYRQGDSEGEAIARRELIVSAGSINSPQLLKVSGVGPAAELNALGIPVVHRPARRGRESAGSSGILLPGGLPRARDAVLGMNPWSKALIGARWLLRHDGLGATNHFETCGFIRSRAGIPYPDIQYHFLPMAVSYDGSNQATQHGFQAHVGPMRSKSRGSVRLVRPIRATIAPHQIQLYESSGRLGRGARLRATDARDLCAAGLQSLPRKEMQPGAAVQTDEQIDAFIREKIETAYHPSCSCKMGAASDPIAVVDPQTRVIGLEGLRVVDSSIMPSITNGNLNAPTIMIAEKSCGPDPWRDAIACGRCAGLLGAELGLGAALIPPATDQRLARAANCSTVRARSTGCRR